MQVDVLIKSDTGSELRSLDVAGALTVGRAPDCTVPLDCSLVSRYHTTLTLQGSRMKVRDTSRNGTLAGIVLLSNDSAEVPVETPITVGLFTLSLRVPSLVDGSEPQPDAENAPGRELNDAEMTASSGARAGADLPPAVLPSANQAAQKPPVQKGACQSLASKEARTAAESSEETNRATEAARRLQDLSLRREIHRLLLEHLDLGNVQALKRDDPSLRPRVLTALRRIVATLDERIPKDSDRDTLIGELVDEALGLGPLENLLSDPTVSEIMVVDPDTIYVEQSGRLRLAPSRFTDDERVRAVIERIVTPLGRRIDESSPLVDARLRDGSRVNAVIRPLALRGSAITIRKFAKTPLTLDKLIGFGAMSAQMGRFLTRSVIAKKNIVIAGGTGSGKTTLLNVLSAAIPEDERVVTIEDAAELQLGQPHVVSLETRPANMEGKGEYSIRDLVKNALRMRPDRIVVGECRGGEALDMLQAMNTGHDGSLTTTHANSPREAVARLETLVLMSGLELPVRAIREQIAGAVNILVQQSRLSDGSRKVTAISEVVGVNDDGEIELVPIFRFVRSGTGENGKVLGAFCATGFLPTFLDQFVLLGLVRPEEGYL